MPLITKAVFPVAGLGSRFLPATKASPKEMMSIVDKPLIQYAVEEAVAAGMTEMIFITGRHKRAIEDHFDKAYEIETELAAARQEGPARARPQHPAEERLVHLHPPVRAARPGPRRAVRAADRRQPAVRGDARRRLHRRASARSCARWSTCSSTSARRSSACRRSRAKPRRSYGIVRAKQLSERLEQVEGIVEKPKPAEAPSTLGVIGRYILTPRDLLAPAAHRARRGRRDPAHRRHRLADGRGARARLSRSRGRATTAARSSAISRRPWRWACKHPEVGEEFAAYLRESGSVRA